MAVNQMMVATESKTSGGSGFIDPAAAHAKAVELGKHVLRMTTAAGSGHPSSALALSHIVLELMYRQMRWDPGDPWHPGNDRLVLSLGHSVPIVYAAYADLGGYIGNNPEEMKRLRVEDLMGLRELNSVLDGHPNPAEGFPFFDAATGSLGQGLSVAAGLALAARLDGINKRIYCIIGDGESREGQIWEAADFIIDHKLSNVCAIFSCNGHGQAGPVSQQQSADAIADKLRAFRWYVLRIDGHDPKALADAFDSANGNSRPTAIVADTVKGWGVEMMLGSNYHGKPIAAGDLDHAIAQLDHTMHRLEAKPHRIPPPPMPRASSNPPPSVEQVLLPPFEIAAEQAGFGSALKAKKMATRVAYGVALVALGEADKRVVSLDGDVSNSTFADRFAKLFPDRFFECKIGEQNMITAAAGMAAGGKIPFASSFAKFIARGVDQIDMAVISRANVKIVGSHAGVSLAADGPSQMAVSDVAYFRSMSRVDSGNGDMACHFFQPSDAISAYRQTELMANTRGMCYMRTHRPDAAFLYPTTEQFKLRGCKKLREGSHLTLVGSGYMVHTALKAAEELSLGGIQCNVFDAYTFPMDCQPILSAAGKAGGVILTIEDNYAGGLHAEIAEAAAAEGKIRVHGITANRIPKSAKSAEEVFSHVGVGLAYILQRAKELAKG